VGIVGRQSTIGKEKEEEPGKKKNVRKEGRKKGRKCQMTKIPLTGQKI